MYSACFIIPYFGKLPDNFEVFLRTCEINSEFDWMIVTNDNTNYEYPSNVHVKYIEFSQFVDSVQTCFDFPVAIPQPYKICDFRPAFGKIFEKELYGYQFWGHCDSDQYFGKISNFITENILNSYDKILCLGHFTLFRNIPEINNLYLIEDKAYKQGYKDVLTYEGHWIFDEWPKSKRTSINRISKQENIKTYICPECFCDLVPFKSLFRRTIFDFQTETWALDIVKSEIYLWNNGRLFRCYMDSKKLKTEEILYVHIRQRKLHYKNYNKEKKSFLIIPDSLLSADSFSDKEIIKILRKTDFRGIFHPDEILCQMYGIKYYCIRAAEELKSFYIDFMKGEM